MPLARGFGKGFGGNAGVSRAKKPKRDKDINKPAVGKKGKAGLRWG
jgi:hypothetical protein